MLGWFHALMPKEERFFDLFARHSEAVVAGAQALRQMMAVGDAIAASCQIVMDREQDADNVTREVLIAVFLTVTTPVTLILLARAALFRDRTEAPEPGEKPVPRDGDRPA